MKAKDSSFVKKVVIISVFCVTLIAVTIAIIVSLNLKSVKGAFSDGGAKDSAAETVNAKTNNTACNSTASNNTSSSETSSIVSQDGKEDIYPDVSGHFKDAVFIGDSITTGISHFKLTETEGVFSTNNMSLTTVSSAKVKVEDKDVPLFEALTSIKPARVYVLLGANDITYMSSKEFASRYSKVIDKIKESVPNSKIYIQSVFPVTEEYDKNHNLKNANINACNEELKKLCESKNVKYIDVASEFKNDDGVMPINDTADGLNICYSSYKKWLNFLDGNQ